MTSSFDHLVFGVATLAQGIVAFERTTGARLPPGGAHPLMSTHNALTRLSDGGFVELIAIDPGAAPTDRVRWFSLDDPATAAQLAIGPSLLSWVVSVPDIDAASAAIRARGIDPGRVIEQRRGDLLWRITVRDDGSLIENGAFPALIQWPVGVDATARMQDIGLNIASRRVTHPHPQRLRTALESIGASDLVTLDEGPAALHATLDGPDGSSSVWSSA